MPRSRSWLLPLVLLLASSAAWAEPPKMSITGPTQVIPGSAVFLTCDTDAVALEWIVFPQSASGNFIPLTLFQGMSPDGKPILKYAAFFSSPTPGTYVFVVVGCKQDQLGKAVHTLTNGTPDPGPDPNPTPPPVPPVPPGERFVLVVSESATRTAAQKQTLDGLTSYLTSKKVTWRVEDPDLKDYSTKKTPAWFKTFLDKITEAKVPHPVLIVSAPNTDGSENKILAIVPLPSTAEAAIAVVKANGG